MTLNMLFVTTLLMYLINIVPTYSFDYENEYYMDSFSKSAEVPAPPSYFSSGTLKSHRYGFYDTGKNRTFVLSAPDGYVILATLQFLDLRPNKKDTLTLFDNEQRSLKALILNNSKTYGQKETFEDENRYKFYAPSGKLGVTFTTDSSWSSIGYDGFKLIYTVQGKYSGDCGYSDFWCENYNCIFDGFKCDGHNNCGDRSDEKYCWTTARPTSPMIDYSSYGAGRLLGITFGVFFVAIAIGCGIFIAVRRANVTRTEIRTVHPPPRPGTYYPNTPPPPYSVSQGINNPGFT